MPSRPAAAIAAVARYGFIEPSGRRISMRPYGMRTHAVRLLLPYAMYAGAQVAPDSARPTTSRLYEFTVGAQTAASARRVREQPAEKPVAQLGQPEAALIRVVVERRCVFSSVPIEMWKCAPVPVRFENGLGMKVAMASWARAIFARGHLELDEVVGGAQRIRVGEVDFELAVRILVIDLVDVDADGAQMTS